MGLFSGRRQSSGWSDLQSRDADQTGGRRDVHSAQSTERGERGQVESKTKEKVGSFLIAILFGGIGYILTRAVLTVVAFYQFITSPEDVSIVDFEISAVDFSGDWRLLAGTLIVFVLSWLIVHERMMMAWRSRNAMFDTTDINTYENDQHLMFFEEMQEAFDWFPDTGAHSSVQVSSMLSHMMLDKKGLKSIDVTKRHKKDVLDEDGNVLYYKGEPVRDNEGRALTVRKPIIDEDFGQDLFTASGILLDEKDVRKPFDVRKIPYNLTDESGNRKSRDKLNYDYVKDLINNDWEMPEYEVQRPAGAYLVDTQPVNTMVLAITRAGKGQTVIEPTIDMWTREKRQNNIVINDPKGELLVKFFVPATVRGYEVVQFNLINPLNTDIYNPLGFAAEAARDGDYTKAAAFVNNIGDIFFPADGADDPMWPNAANNAFKRSAFGLIDFYLEEEKRKRKEAEIRGTSEKVLMQEIDDMWGKVTLYNTYQLFVILSSRKSTDPKMIKIDEDESVKEKDFLTLFFDATAKLPQNEMRKMVQNADNSLRAMAGSDKTIASVYGIALTAMSFFTDPTISTLTSGKPSQNFDAEGLSFPRRMGVRFGPEFMDRYKYVGLQAVWEAYSDKAFKNKLDDKLFGHTDIINREGWARYFFDGKFENRKSYIKLKIVNPKTNLLVKTFYFEVELTYKTDLSGRRYVKDPVTGKKIIRDGVLREMMYSKAKKTYVFKDTMVKRRYRDLFNQEEPETLVEVPGFLQKTVKYTERPKAVFFITPPHLMSYAKLILILIKQMVDMNFEGAYLTKENQKPLYKTRYMLDEVGNLQSEGNGIPALQTMLSIGLGQDQQFTLILQTLQQLRDVYGESVDRVIQGNIENIIFLKSTDEAMIENLVKLSGTTHESRMDQKTITQDNEKLFNKNEGRISYTLATKERPVIEFNDFMFIEPRNSIILKAGSSPIWNRRETAYPMSWRLFQKQISVPGKDYSLQTIPTNSSARDFDVRKNQPDFYKMLEERLKQAREVDLITEAYKTAYNLEDADFIRLDQNVVADDIMHAINSKLYGIDHKEVAPITPEEMESLPEMDDLGFDIANNSVENTEMLESAREAGAKKKEHERKRYAGGKISRSDLVTIGGAVIRQLEVDLMIAYNETKQYFAQDNRFRVAEDTWELSSDTGDLFIRSTRGSNRKDIEALENAEEDPETKVYGEDGALEDVHFEATDAFIKYLATFDSWDSIAEGRFDPEVKKAYIDREMN